MMSAPLRFRLVRTIALLLREQPRYPFMAFSDVLPRIQPRSRSGKLQVGTVEGGDTCYVNCGMLDATPWHAGSRGVIASSLRGFPSTTILATPMSGISGLSIFSRAEHSRKDKNRKPLPGSDELSLAWVPLCAPFTASYSSGRTVHQTLSCPVCGIDSH